MSIDKQARDVSRYDLVSGYMQRWTDGEFVYHSDYLELLGELEAAEGRNTVLIEFLTHIKRCLVKNREYAPLSHEEIDTLLGINAAGISVKGE
ncbi:hypothetical protein [Lelliottia amnigena]